MIECIKKEFDLTINDYKFDKYKRDYYFYICYENDRFLAYQEKQSKLFVKDKKFKGIYFEIDANKDFVEFYKNRKRRVNEKNN